MILPHNSRGTGSAPSDKPQGRIPVAPRLLHPAQNEGNNLLSHSDNLPVCRVFKH